MQARALGNNLAILAMGGLLVGYLLLLIGVGALGQAQLRNAAEREAHFDLEKREAVLSYFFAERRDDMAMLAEDRALETYFANQALGMSMAYGLRASLLSLRERLVRLKQLKRVGDIDVYRRITLFRGDGQALADSLSEEASSMRWDNLAEILTADRPVILIGQDPGGPQLHAAAPVRYKGQLQGVVIGTIDSQRVLDALYPEQRDQAAQEYALLGPSGVAMALATGNGAHGPPPTARTAIFMTAVSGTPLRLAAYAEPRSGQRYFTSPWFLAALFLLAIPVSFGVWRLLRMNSQNLVLQALTEAAQRQRDALSERNVLLQAEVAKRLEYEQLLARQANFDPLTDLPNRNLALDRLTQAIKRARREQLRVLAMFLDLDHFKLVNDSLGHGAGDVLLREAAARLGTVTRDSDTLARLGGDEFLLVFTEIHNAGNAELLATEVLNALRPPFHIRNQEFFIGASIGMALYPDDGDTAEALLKNADIALYRAKHEGRNRFHFFTTAMDTDARERLALDSHLRHAIERDELHVVYQPLVDLQSRHIIGVEALLRWQSAALGNVSPVHFIPLAEDTGIIHELTAWVLQQACTAAAQWNRQRPLRLAVNISAKEFVHPEKLLATVERLLTASGLAPAQLELELTESLLVQATPAVGTALAQLHDMGIRLSVDDFGTGYSALSYLQRFPFDTLKIDRSFVQGVEDNPASAALVRAIAKMAEALGLETVAEGVETEDQVRFLGEVQCPLAQGYLFSRPLTAAAMQQLLERERPAVRPRLLVGN